MKYVLFGVLNNIHNAVVCPTPKIAFKISIRSGELRTLYTSLVGHYSSRVSEFLSYQ